MEQSLFMELEGSLLCSRQSTTSPYTESDLFMELEGSLLCSQQSTTGPYTESDQSNPQLPITCF